MEGTTFDLTAPVSILQTKIPPPKPAPQGPEPLPQSQAPKSKEVISTNQGKNRLPPVGQKSSALTRGVGMSSSSKSLQRQRKLDVFRDALDQAIKQQPKVIQSKKEKKTKTSQENNKKEQDQLDEIQKEYQEKVKKYYEEVYSDPKQNAVQALRQLEAKPNVQSELLKTEYSLNKRKMKNDHMIYEIKQMMIKSKRLDELIAELQNSKEASDSRTIEELLTEEKQQEEFLSKMSYDIAILRGMYDTRRKLLLEVQKNCKSLHSELEHMRQRRELMQGSYISKKEQMESFSKLVQRFKEEQSHSQPFFGASLKQRFDPMLEEILEDELSKCGDRQALDEVTQKEKKKKMKKEEEERNTRKRQQIQAQEEMDNATKQIRVDKMQIETLLINKRKMFEDLRRVTNISDLEKLIPHKEGLDHGARVLDLIQGFVATEIEKIEKENETLKKDIKELKYQQEMETAGQQSTLDQLERDLVKASDKLEEKEKQVKKTQKSIDEVTMSLSRILYQLQGKVMKSKNVEIGQKGLVGAASSIQLRLERMLTVLSKTQEFLIEESVNSNPQYVRVPDFIGLNQKRYADMEPQEFQDTNLKFQYREDESQDEEEKYFDEQRKSVKAITEKDKPQIVVAAKKEKKTRLGQQLQQQQPTQRMSD